jgi:3-oxoacyl-[acyl-carrier protein] reductase
MALAEAGASVVINGRNAKLLEQTAQEIRKAAGVEVWPVLADLSTPDGQAALLAACPAPDILVNNNGGPPYRDFRELNRSAMLDGVTMNMVTPIELIQKVIDGMAERGFGRIVNITSVSVKMPLAGLDLSSGARAGLTAFVAGIARGVVARNVTINNMLPGSFDTARIRGSVTRTAAKEGHQRSRGCAPGTGSHSGQTLRHCRGVRTGVRLSLQRAHRLHDRSEHLAGWRRLPGSVLIA